MPQIKRALGACPPSKKAVVQKIRVSYLDKDICLQDLPTRLASGRHQKLDPEDLWRAQRVVTAGRETEVVVIGDEKPAAPEQGKEAKSRQQRMAKGSLGQNGKLPQTHQGVQAPCPPRCTEPTEELQTR